ncbi:hypothetical protein [Cytobacillus pseudoceanisediminis]|uniref:hypothetical protein n=1 Tax=Cytobacillus pseudoceanisediminis TaxID=3051614 RepID=UPI003C2F7133
MERKRIAYWAIPLILFICFLGSAVYTAGQPEAASGKNQSALKGQYYLEDVVKIYVPSTYDVDQPIDNTPLREQNSRKILWNVWRGNSC